MPTINEIQTLAHVSSEINESEIKITFANQCIKAQDSLSKKLKEEIQRRKEICNFKKNENLKLEAEIKNAELEIENLRITYKLERNTNTEIKKELLLTKEKKSEIIERIKKGEKKYQDRWVESKKRYESIPLVKELMDVKNKAEAYRNELDILKNEEHVIDQAIEGKKDELKVKDKKMVLQLANYMVHEMPALVKTIKEKSSMLNKLTKELENYEANHENSWSITDAVLSNGNNTNKNEKDRETINKKWSIDDTFMIPKLQLPSIDTDITKFKLDINKVTLHTSPIKRSVSVTNSEGNRVKRPREDEQLKDNYISCYLKNSVAMDDDSNQDDTAVNYSNKKLINILEDIKIDDSKTYELVAKANIDKFHDVDVIVANKVTAVIRDSPPLQCEEIEEIDLTTSQNVLIPPTQYQDYQGLTQEIAGESKQQEIEVVVHEDAGHTHSKNSNVSQEKSSQESNKKKVSFELPMAMQEADEILTDDLNKSEDKNPNVSNNSQLDLSILSDDNYMAIKDMILKKKQQLDLSPQFMYGKNMLLKKYDDHIVTSKFFESTNDKNDKLDNKTNENENNNSPKVQRVDQCENVNNKAMELDAQKNFDGMEVDSGPKARDPDEPMAGMLFTHGPQGIIDLDISMGTTVYEEGESDFPNCLDSSLLLSPKADLPLPMSGNENEAVSQDVPNFLVSGFKKTGLSFFKQRPTEANPESSQHEQENNFSFSFGGDEKKARGGLFSFFR